MVSVTSTRSRTASVFLRRPIFATAARTSANACCAKHACLSICALHYPFCKAFIKRLRIY